METKELIEEIRKLPVGKQIYVIDRTMRSIRKLEEKKQMEKAADALYEDYLSDEELTAFTCLDFEDFYETR